MDSILDKARRILLQAENYQEFEEKYSENLRFSGERMVDAAVFVFDLGKGYSLLVGFTEYSFDNFSIIHKSLGGDTLMYLK